MQISPPLSKVGSFLRPIDLVSLNSRMNGLLGPACAGRVTARAEDAQGTPTQSHILPSMLVYQDNKEEDSEVLR